VMQITFHHGQSEGVSSSQVSKEPTELSFKNIYK